jgi:hypothetical protein
MAAPGDHVGRAQVVRIVHDIPGRLRLRLPVSADGAGVAERVRGLAGVEHCAWSPRTEGLLTVYGPPASADTIIQAVRDATGLDTDVDAANPSDGAPDARPTLGTAVAGAAGEIDRRLRAVTRDAVGLGSLIPVALTVWAARELLLGRAGPLAWSTALWYAHGLFRDYNTPAS